jgi:acyl carrier protein
MTIDDRVRDVLRKTLALNDDQLNSNTLLADDLEISSLDRIELMMGIEDEFGVELNEQEQASIKSIDDLIECVKSHGKPQGVPMTNPGDS